MKCEISCKDGSHEPLELHDGEAVTVGRSPATGITDSKVSRQHIQLKVDYSKQAVEVKQLGTNSCFVDGTALEKGSAKVYSLEDGPLQISFLENKYPHMIRFKTDDECKQGKKEQKKNISDFFKPKGQKRKSEAMETENGSKKSRSESPENTGANCNEESESDDEDRKRIQKQLKLMKANFKKTEASAKPISSYHEDGEVTTKKPPARTGSPATEAKWEQHGKLLMFTSLGVKASHKIAGFDIDSTIICTQSGRVFATHPGDWKIMLTEIPGKLKKLNIDGYKIVFFTNQSGIQRGKVKVPDFKNKIENIMSKLGLPIQVFISTGHGPFRKPGLGMWNFLCERSNDKIEIDVSESFYVGDAAGRPAGWAPGKKKDFSTSDRLFALNAGLKFFTPEEYFLGHKRAMFNMPEFDPRNLPERPLPKNITSSNQEVIVSVGFPASGKSSFAKTHLVPKGYVQVNRDTLKTWQKCVEATKKALREGKSVVVDNTNPDVESRKRYIQCAKDAKVDCRCFVFTTSLTQCMHNERFREMTDKSHEPINDMIMNSFKSKFVEAKASEGFSEIVKIDFAPNFTNKEHERVYKQFLLEK